MTSARDGQVVKARQLLIELLAYQFAFPVRWIETQEHFLKAGGDAQRVIEIGPSQVLTPMASKTAAKQFAAYDGTHFVNREFLSLKNHADKIYYNYSKDELPEAPPMKSQSPEHLTAVHATEAVPAPLPTPAPVALPGPAKTIANIEDKPLSATDIVISLTAQKMKTAFDELKLTESVRGLSGGKSTLQNELIGDFAIEFGDIPAGAEDLSLEALGAALDLKFSGNPGKQISSIIAKLVSSKMPGGFNQNAMKAYLESHWNIPKQRQSTVICLATTLEPSARIGDEKSAKKWLDLVASRYSSHFGLDLRPGQSVSIVSGTTDGDVLTGVDARSLEAAREEQRKMLHAQFIALKKHLEDDEDVGNKQMSEIMVSLEECERKLFQWGIEFDDDFFNGIRPIFDAGKARSYDSWWNWAREDVIILLNGISTGLFERSSAETAKLLSTIRNRLDDSCEAIFKYRAHDLAQSGFVDLLRRDSLINGAERPRFSYQRTSLAPLTEITKQGEINYEEVPRTQNDVSGAVTYSQIVRCGSALVRSSFLHIRTRADGVWILNEDFTSDYLDALDRGMSEGLSFKGRSVLVTGAGLNSIGADVVQGLLTGGANVVVTTSRAPSASASFYQKMYRDHAGPGATLKVLPFNAGSRSDCDHLLEYIYGPESGISDLDFIVPFAAIPQTGDVDSLSSKSELAHRAMLTNVLRLLGGVKRRKAERQFYTRPTNVLLPLSPNHGTFGGDGLYGESKLGLETLFNRGQSEDWDSLVTITGVVIGWTRGTALMSANNIIASTIEKHGVMTFAQSEMAFNILALMSPEISALSEDEPIYADLSGGLHMIHDLKDIISRGRDEIAAESRLRKAIIQENEREIAVLTGEKAPQQIAGPIRPRTILHLDFPTLGSYEMVTNGTEDLEGMPDLERVIVVVAYSELGPWGSTRTRWEIEKSGDLTQAGLVEMAWIMGLVKHYHGDLNDGWYAGWVDAESHDPVHESDFKSKYENTIMEHSGLRFIEPEGLQGYDPHNKEILQEIVLEDDLPPFEAAKSSAEAFLRRHGELCHLEPIPDSEDYKVHIKKGAVFYVPKAIQTDRFVAGQLPKGWSPARYGIPDDIVTQVDPVVLYALCCLSEAVLMAGLQDPLELYKYIHVSELCNCIGTGAGSLLAMRGIYRDRYLDRPVQNDMLQESYLNAIGAWSNMLLLASSGPIRSPTGTCATSVESLDAGCEAIKAGKAKVAIVGGCDDFQEEMSYEFGNMKATANTRDELKKGRLPSEMSRPTASSRSGFIESAGCGVQIIMTADLALRMGLPIYGIVSYTHMASDKVGRSVPAPGQGILTAAKETLEASQSPLLDFNYRREMLQHQLSTIAMQHKMQSRIVANKNGSQRAIETLERSALASARDARNIWSNDIRRQDPEIAPMRAALATWGLTIDDIQVASFHGTSTKANDRNESNVVNTQMRHLGRTCGNPLLVVAQKYLTGHAKGAAGAFMINGGLQILQHNLVPGNRNADNVDAELQQYEHLVFPTNTIRTPGIKSFMVTSFGFGQKGGLVIMVHPHHLFAAISKESYGQYCKQVSQRRMRANARFARALRENDLFRPKSSSPWDAAGEQEVFLDPAARVSGPDPFTLSFDPSNIHPTDPAASALLAGPVMRSVDVPSPDPSSLFQNFMQEALRDADPAGVGVDIEPLSAIPTSNTNFVSRNYTKKEQQYCKRRPDSQASFAGRWTAKEAVFKSLQTRSRGAGTAMDEVEILPDAEGVPKVTLHGEAARAAKRKGVARIEVSISHAENQVMAAAVAIKKGHSNSVPGTPSAASTPIKEATDLATSMFSEDMYFSIQ